MTPVVYTSHAFALPPINVTCLCDLSHLISISSAMHSKLVIHAVGFFAGAYPSWSWLTMLYMHMSPLTLCTSG